MLLLEGRVRGLERTGGESIRLEVETKLGLTLSFFSFLVQIQLQLPSRSRRGSHAYRLWDLACGLVARGRRLALHRRSRHLGRHRGTSSFSNSFPPRRVADFALLLPLLLHSFPLSSTQTTKLVSILYVLVTFLIV